ncbi:MAG: hypothetical protein SFY68_04405 [Candidatus Sumerlaeia bacterium]|nr:hypothetical protein [Candidatus Sumerlaeia bacterium]
MIRTTLSLKALLPTLAVALLSNASLLEARTKLVTLPERAELVVNLEKPETSLLTESRPIALQKGTNFIDFSWQGVNIDQGSILLTPLTHPGTGPEATKVINVNFPPNEQALTWEVYSPEARTEEFRVSYQLYGIQRDHQYTLVVNEAETEASFQHMLEMANQSGEELNNAAIRLTGTEDLMRSVDSGEVRRFTVAQRPSVPIKKIYISRPALDASSTDDGEQITLVYELENSSTAGLGNYLLQPGKARLFGKDPSGSTIFLGEDFLQTTALGEPAKLTLGNVKDILFKRRIVSDQRTNERRGSGNRVTLYDRVVELRYDVENFKDKPSVLRIVEQLPPDAVLVDTPSTGFTWKRTSSYEVEIEIQLEPRPTDEKAEVPVQEFLFKYRIDNIVN